MSNLQARAEVLKLERLLETDDLGFLADLPAEDLQAFREQATERLFGASALGSVAGAARLLPTGIIATIAERAFGPLLCARAAGGVDPKTAIEVARRLPPEFLADVAVHLDPRRVARIIAGVPADLVPGVAEILGERREHVTMGRFLAFVPDSAIAAAMGVLPDEALVRTAFVLEHKDRLDHAIGLLPDDRIPGVLRYAAAHGLWPEALDLLDQLSDARRGPIADVVARDATDILESLVAAVHEGELWDVMLPLVETMQPVSRERLAQVPAFHDPDVMRGIIEAAAASGLWVELVPLLAVLPPNVAEQLPDLVGNLDPAVLERIVTDALAAPETLPALLEFVPAELQAVVPAVAAGLDHDTLAHVLDVIVAHPETLPPLLPVVDSLAPEGRAAIITVIDEAGRDLADVLVRGVADLPEAGVLLAGLPEDVHAAITRAAERLGLTDVLLSIAAP